MERPEERAWFSQDDVDYYTDFLTGSSDVNQRNFKTLLATVAEVLGETDLDALLRKLVEHSIRTTRSERGILILEEGGGLRVRVALDIEGRDLGQDVPMARTVAERVFRSGRPVIRSVSGDHEVLDLSHSAAVLRLREVMCAPLRARGQALGAIYVDSTIRGAPRTDADLNLFHAQAGLMGMAVENHRLFQEAWNARDVQRQLAVAREIQRRLFPRTPARFGGTQLAGLNLISAQVGGDYFDYLPLDADRITVSVGDVSGHGVAPALIMSDVRVRLRSLLQTQPGLPQVHAGMNEGLRDELAEGMYVALFVGIYDARAGTLDFRNAGHVPPLLFRRRGGDVLELAPTAPALALFPEVPDGPTPSVPVAPGDCLVCYTDGVVDRADADGEMYGLDRLKATLARTAREGATAEEIAEAIRAEADTFAGDRPLRDDFTLLVARF